MINQTLKNANILIVDDQEANIDVLVGLLEFQGYTNLKTTTDSRLAVSLFSTFNPDIILLDLMMPHISGYEVMKQLHTVVPNDTYLPILVLTADINFEAKQRALSEGATDFISKPFDLIEVGLRIRNLLFARYQHIQLMDQNQNLEEKIKERTIVLENTNIELKAAKEKAEESDRLKTAFLQNISHEIRTPLNGIIGFSKLLQEENISQEDIKEFNDLIEKSGFRLIETVNNIIELSMIETGQVEIHIKPFLVNLLIYDLFDKFQPIANSKGIKLNYNISLNDDILISDLDESKLNIIFTHLLDNALKFINTGSIEFGYSIKDNNIIQFFVKDTGCGISPKNHERIFEKFVQADLSNTRGFEGAGLGLSISKGLVELLGGKIWVESELGKGSTFYVEFPKAEIMRTLS